MSYKRLPTLNWLRVFEAAARHQSFSAAAAELNVSTSAVSQQVAALEERLSYKLFERRAQGVALTTLGQVFEQDVARALRDLDTSVERLFPLPGTKTVTVQTNTIFATSWLSPRLSKFQKAYPGIFISISCQDDYSAYRPGRADIQISFATDLSAIGNAEPLFAERVYPVACREIADQISDVHDLFDFALIDEPSHQLSWSRMLQAAGVGDLSKARHMRVSNSTLALSLAASGSGIALARAPATDWLVNQYDLQALDGLVQLDGDASYFLAVRQDARIGGPIHLFRSWILSEIADYTGAVSETSLSTRPS